MPWVKDYSDATITLDDSDMPASVKELYSYNPDKAKQLLAEAGYPPMPNIRVLHYGLGPIGGLDHSPEEYLEVDSIVPRTTLLAALLLAIARDPDVAAWRAGPG